VQIGPSGEQTYFYVENNGKANICIVFNPGPKVPTSPTSFRGAHCTPRGEHSYFYVGREQWKSKGKYGSTSNCRKTYLRKFYLQKILALILLKNLFAE
jgi:hypothetical protein